jgi:hypothetical protein
MQPPTQFSKMRSSRGSPPGAFISGAPMTSPAGNALAIVTIRKAYG